MAVPGEIQAYEEAHRLFGRLPWATLFQPTIKLARDGLPVAEVLGRYLSSFNWTGYAPLRYRTRRLCGSPSEFLKKRFSVRAENCFQTKMGTC